MAGSDDDRRRQHRPRWAPTGFVPDCEDSVPPPPTPISDDPWIGCTLDERFEIVEAIGRGGMATVYRARESGLISRDVAIKVLSRDSSQDQTVVARFRREAQLITDIHHPHVVNVFHVGRTDRQLYIVMELLRGQSLQATLQAHGSLPWSRVAPMMLNVCAALQAAHEHAIIHRDIKPSNCFRVDATGNCDFIKVLDFGIAKAKPRPDVHDEGTQQGTFLGTPHYAAPEIIDPQGGPVDGRVDMYALGVVMYLCVTGSLPFAGARGLEALRQTVQLRPQSPRDRAPEADIPPAVDALIMRSLARHPENRFADMATLADAIRDATGPQRRPRRDEIRTGVIDDSTPQRPPRQAPQTRPDGSFSDVEPTPPPLPRSPAESTHSDGSRPSLTMTTGGRPVVATFGVIILGVLLLAALLGHDASRPRPPKRWIPDSPQPALLPQPSLPPPPAPPPQRAPLDPIEEDSTPETSVRPDPKSDSTTGEHRAKQAIVDERRKAILAMLRQWPRAEHATRCGISIVDSWRLPVRLRIDPGGNVDSVTTTSKALPTKIRACLLEHLKPLHFPRGDTTLEVSYTFQGGQ